MQAPTLALDDVSIPLIQGGLAMPAQIPSSPAQAAVHEGKVDFWHNLDQSEPVGVAHLDPPVGVFVHEVEAETSRAVKATLWIAGALFTLSVGYIVWNFFSNAQTPSQSFGLLWKSIAGTEEVHPIVEKPKVKLKLIPGEVAAARPVAVARVVPGRIFENPYAHLENQMSDQNRRRTGVLTGDLAVQTREGLNHEFYYQRYRAVLALVGNRYDGSESLLRDALQTGKYWMRMQAVMGLADMGYDVSPDDIKTALSEGHDELRERYFKRFERGACTLGCQFVARGTLMFLNAPGRLAALNVMASDKNTETSDYMVAATFDADERVRTFATSWLLKHPVSESDWWRVYETIAEAIAEDSGDATADGTVTAPNG